MCRGLFWALCNTCFISCDRHNSSPHQDCWACHRWGTWSWDKAAWLWASRSLSAKPGFKSWSVHLQTVPPHCPPSQQPLSFSICVGLDQRPPFPGQVAHVLRESIIQCLWQIDDKWVSKGRHLGLNLYFQQSMKLAYSKSLLSNSRFLTRDCGWASGSP